MDELNEEVEFLQNYVKAYENEHWTMISKEIIHMPNGEPVVVGELKHKTDANRYLISFTKKDKSMAFDPETFWLLTVQGRLFAAKHLSEDFTSKILHGKR